MSDWGNRRPGDSGEDRRNFVSSLYASVWRRYFMRSGIGTAVLIGCVLIGLTIAFHAHQEGNFHKLKLKANIETNHTEAPTERPGGQDPIVLVRSQMVGDTAPQFLSATLLPGRGMNVLQITAFIPGRGEVSLLASPTLDSAAATMTGTGADTNGQASLAMGGAFEVPWADELGQAGSAQAPDGSPLPPLFTGALSGQDIKGGLMLGAGADSPDSEALPDGGSSHAVFHENDFGGKWLSTTDVTVNAQMSSRVVELTVNVTNIGDVAEPVGIGWNPRFAIVSGDRAALRLHVPADSRVEMRGNERKQPTGKLIPVAGGAKDFSAEGGALLGADGLAEYYTDLQQKMLDNGPAAELINRTAGYGLRLTAMSGKIRAMRVYEPAGGDFVTIDPQYNYPDAFGKEWSSDTDTGMVMLGPGQSTEWKVRLELYALSDDKH